MAVLLNMSIKKVLSYKSLIATIRLTAKYPLRRVVQRVSLQMFRPGVLLVAARMFAREASRKTFAARSLLRGRTLPALNIVHGWS